MVVHTKEQIELINWIRHLLQMEQVLNYDETVLLYDLEDQANAQNLCWW